MSGASNVLDPVEAAKNDISRSRHLIASTLDDLSQHHSWLEDYHRAERQRAQRLRRQEALRRLELRRQRAAWTLRWYAITIYAAGRAATAFATRHGHALAAWAAPRARVIAWQSQSVLSTSVSWSSRTARLLGRKGRAAAKRGYETAQRGFAWSVQASDDAGIVFRRAVLARGAILTARLVDLTAPSHRRATIAFTRTRHRAWAQARVLARQAQSALAAAASWSSRTARLLGRKGRAAAKIGYETAQRGFAWSVQASDDAGIVFRRAVLARGVILSARLVDLTAPSHRRATIAFTRTRHRVGAQARVLARQAQSALAATASWSSRTARLLAREGRAASKRGYEAAQRAFAWSVQTSDDAGIVFRRAALARGVILSARLADLTAPTYRRATIAFTRTRHRVGAQARLLEARLTSAWRARRRTPSDSLSVTREAVALRQAAPESYAPAQLLPTSRPSALGSPLSARADPVPVQQSR